MLRAPLVLLAISACTGGMQDPASVEQQNGACIALEGRTFSSVNELECGLTPNGPALCHWSLVFATRDARASDFAWSSMAIGDVGEQGTVACRGESLTATAASRTVAGSFDPATQNLVWATETYVASP